MSTLTYTKLPHPLRDGELLYHETEAFLNGLEDAAHGAPLRRAARGATAPPEEADVRGLESRLRRAAASRSRGAFGRAIWWFLLGPALALLWVNFAPAIALLFFWLPPLAELIATLGGVAGGPVLAAAVGLVPLIWAWRRSGRHWAESRRWSRLARLAGARRLNGVALERTADPAVAAFAAVGATPVARLRDRAAHLTENGADAAAELAQTAREVYQLAQRHGLPEVAGAYHALYTRFDAAERRLTEIERAGGVLAERKMVAESKRVRRQVGATLAAFSPTGPVRSRLLVPLGALLAGLAVLALTLIITGTYFVNPGEAVIVDPLGSRLARLGALVGMAEGDGAAAQVVRTEGFHLGWPRPLVDRHSVTLQEQSLRLQAAFRQTGPDRYDVLQVEMRFRIADPNRWAQLDRDGTGVDALAGRLSGFLETVIQQQRQEARRLVAQQNPALANDPQQIGEQADALVESRLNDTVRDFVAALSDSTAARDSGVQISREVQSRLVKGVPGALAGVTESE
jgi:hypothetical protein